MSEVTGAQSASGARTAATEQSGNFIAMRHVVRAFGAQTVLNDVSLNVRRGSTRVILGLSGSGKSVLMKHMIGLLRPDAGEVWVDGEDITSLGAKELLEVRRKFGMVFQQSALFDSMTVADNVAFPLREHTTLSPQAIAEKVEATLSLVALADMRHKWPAELSGGMRKRVALARAVVLAPACVLYDEPTTGLDPITTGTVDDMIKTAQRALNVTSVVISHDISSALKIADDIAVIDGGKIVADCPVADIHQVDHPFVQAFLRAATGGRS